MKRNIVNLLKRDMIFFIFLLILIIFSLLFPKEITNYPKVIDWKTILMLSGLLITTTGIKESKVLRKFIELILKRSHSERGIALRLIVITAILSAFITNDITLFILIPLTLNMQKLLKNDLNRIIIFEAIAVNVGSALTPIGNPQNIYLWHKSGLTFISFMVKMLPITIIQFIILIVFALFTFKDIPLSLNIGNNKNEKQSISLFIWSVLLLTTYVVFMNFGQHFYLPILAMIFIFYLLFNKKIIKNSDWILILLFCEIFIDFHLIAQIPFINSLVTSISLNRAKNLFLTSIATSQIMSNVPASIFLTKFSKNFTMIAYGVNVGGNGFIIGSLANIIALRLSKKKLNREFHKYSIPFLVVSTVIILFIL